VTTVRDRLRLPATLDRSSAPPVDLARCAEDVCADRLMEHAPLDEPLTPSEILPILKELTTP
jgi:hypothetical protein